VQCWGDNRTGQLGDGTIVNRNRPVQVIAAGSGATSVAAGDRHTCAAVSGGVMCWGRGSNGESGPRPPGGVLTPIAVTAAASGAQAVTAGALTSCALVFGGVQCWGYYVDGELGDGSLLNTIPHPIPVLAREGSTVGINSPATAILVGSVARFTAVVSVEIGTPTGTVTFMEGSTALGTVTLDATGSAAFQYGGFTTGKHAISAVYGGDANFAAATSPTITLSVGNTLSVVEFYNATLDHYFITWVSDEIAKLDAGTAIKGWVRTGQSFLTYLAAPGGTSPVCRYYIPPGLGDSHFFGRGAVECGETGQKNPSFILEDPAFMQMYLPTLGNCPSGTTEIYRVFSNRADANHRYMTDKALRASMVAKGWLAEGDGPNLVVMCAQQ
jgi:hypothetical protein